MNSLKKEIYQIKRKCHIQDNIKFGRLFIKFIEEVFDSFNKLRPELKADYNKEIKWENIESNVFIAKSSLPNSIPSVLRNKIKSEIKYKIIYHLTINNKKITYHIFEKKKSSLQIIRKKIILMNLWMRFLLGKVNNSCSQEINIFIYPIDNLKKFPNSNTEYLGPPHVNTAFTYACIPNNEILIFREEEWFKVFIHETFHSYGLDFVPLSNQINKTINKIFNLNLNYDITESWCETWARIFNVTITSYFKNNNFNDYNKFKICVNSNMKSEVIYSVLQMSKILKFYNVNFEKTMKGIETNNYKESSAVFSYYVLTSLNLVFINDLFSWCKKNNDPLFYFSTDKIKLDSYIDFIKYIIGQSIINPVIKCINTTICDNKKTRKNNSLRMTINEIKL